MKTAVEMAREAGLYTILNEHAHEYGNGYFEITPYPELERFFALVAAAEREACAKECDAIHARHIEAYGDYFRETYASDCAAAIRARGNT
jgi:hypothetical protein